MCSLVIYKPYIYKAAYSQLQYFFKVQILLWNDQEYIDKCCSQVMVFIAGHHRSCCCIINIIFSSIHCLHLQTYLLPVILYLSIWLLRWVTTHSKLHFYSFARQSSLKLIFQVLPHKIMYRHEKKSKLNMLKLQLSFNWEPRSLLVMLASVTGCSLCQVTNDFFLELLLAKMPIPMKLNW